MKKRVLCVAVLLICFTGCRTGRVHTGPADGNTSSSTDAGYSHAGHSNFFNVFIHLFRYHDPENRGRMRRRERHRK